MQFYLENIELVLSVGGTMLGILVTLLVFIKKFIKNKKALKLIETLEDVTSGIIPYIVQAESFKNFTGEEKKEYVLTKLGQLALTMNTEFNEAAISSKIEELLELTNQVNVNKTKEVVQEVQPSQVVIETPITQEVKTENTNDANAEMIRQALSRLRK